jgi:hypothetical protein
MRGVLRTDSLLLCSNEGGEMKRREFIGRIASAVVWPLTASAQEQGKIRLARIAQRWPGRAKLNLVLGEKGYELPTKFVGILVKHFHCSREQIDLYFDEMAKEYFLSLGLANPLFREHRGEVPYRSRFLDDLYAARPPGERRAFPLCLASFFDMTEVPNIGRQMTIEQKAEAERFYGKSEVSIKNEDDLVHVFVEVAEERGFSAGDGVSAERQFSGYSMRCYMEKSERAWRFDTRARAALVDNETGSSFKLFLPMLDMGFAYYSGHLGSRSLAQLGIRAQLDFLDALGSLLA